MSLDESRRDAPVQTFPATLWQEQHWRAHAEFGRDAALNVAMRWRLEGPVPDSTLEAAVRALAKRHEVLRTRFAIQDGNLVQLVEPHPAVRVAHVDLQRLQPDAQTIEIERIGMAEARAPFDLSTAPLMRAMLVRTAPTSAVLHLTLHHLIVDGWSIGLLADELLSMLVGEPQLGPVDLQYGDFASWQRAMIEAGAFDADLDYWRSNLEAAPRFTIPTDRPNAQRTDDIAFIRSETLSRDLRDALIAHARRSGQTMFVTACTAIARVLADYADEDEVQIAVPVAGREDQDEERIVGPLLNAVVLRVPVSNSNDIARVEAAVRSASANALKHARAPFALVADAARLSCNHETPLGMQVNFVLQSANIHVQSAESLGRGGVTLVSLPSYTPGALWPLNFFMVERPDGYRISCEADAALFTPATVDRLIAAWRKALEEAATDRPVSIMSAPPQGAPNPRVIALQAEGALTPVFALNIASIYYPLAKRLGPDRPFFDVRLCPSSHERDLPDRYFADIARDAIDLIRSARPHGPYVLFGLCVAGALAVEAARQLRDAGEDVPLVVLADTWRPGYREDMSRLAKFERGWRVRVARWRMDYERFRDGRQTLAYILNTYPFARALRLAHLAAALGLSPPASMEDAGDHELRWFADHLGAAQTRFRPEPYAGKLLILRSREPLEGRLFARDFGWGPFAAGGAEVADCPGEHATMFRDAGAAAIAKIMNRCLSRMSV